MATGTESMSNHFVPRAQIIEDSLSRVVPVNVDPVEVTIWEGGRQLHRTSTVDMHGGLGSESILHSAMDGIHVGLTARKRSAIPALRKVGSKRPGIDQVELLWSPGIENST